MKQLYRIYITVSINDYKDSSCSALHYGFPPETTTINYTFDEAFNGDSPYFYGSTSLFRKRRRLMLSGRYETGFFYEKEIKSIKIEKKAIPYPVIPTMARLIKELNALEFIDWCKDHDFPPIENALA